MFKKEDEQKRKQSGCRLMTCVRSAYHHFKENKNKVPAIKNVIMLFMILSSGNVLPVFGSLPKRNALTRSFLSLGCALLSWMTCFATDCISLILSKYFLVDSLYRTLDMKSDL